MKIPVQTEDGIEKVSITKAIKYYKNERERLREKLKDFHRFGRHGTLKERQTQEKIKDIERALAKIRKKKSEMFSPSNMSVVSMPED